MKSVFHQASLIGKARWVGVSCGRYHVWTVFEQGWAAVS